jgi:2,3-bisphosphoglycerate-independent phosphoglycerate mutase
MNRLLLITGSEYKLKYFILVPDGCGDLPIDSLGGKTPLEAAHMSTIHELAKKSEVGTVKTIPDGYEAGSDVANLSIMGFDPKVYLTGRASLEAVGAGLTMTDTETAVRVNLITVSGEGEYTDLIIKDHSAGDISNEEAEILISDINQKLGNNNQRFYPGVSYRNLLITDALFSCNFTPPHDVLNQAVGKHLPKGENTHFFIDLMQESYTILKNHPVNVQRAEKGLNTADSIWFWGAGKKPSLPLFEIKYGINGSVISAVGLIKGIALCAGLTSVDVPGATGTLDTNYDGKAAYAIEEFKKGKDFVFVHVEAPDECSHCGDLNGKMESMKRIDQKIAKPVLAYLKDCGEPYRVLILPDHMTPIATRTHSATPIPFVLFDSKKTIYNENNLFTEACGKQGLYFDNGYDLTDYFFR